MPDNKNILLSIVFGAKNDSYMEYSPGIGGANHRISISINKWLDNIEKCNTEYNTNDIELVICDWNSKEKIIDYIIDPKYKNYTYIFVPEEVASQYKTEFSIVHSLNCAYKHSTGEYILFCDSDSYFSYENFKRCYNLIKNLKEQNNINTGYWIPRKHIPREAYINFKNFIDVDTCLMKNNINYGYAGPIYTNDKFCGGAAGLVISKSMAEETTCWYERYINWGELDIDMDRRLISQYKIGYIDIDSLCLLHLYHHDSKTKRIGNKRIDTNFKANNDPWGLSDKILEVIKK